MQDVADTDRRWATKRRGDDVCDRAGQSDEGGNGVISQLRRPSGMRRKVSACRVCIDNVDDVAVDMVLQEDVNEKAQR